MRTWAIPLAGATILLGNCAAIAYITGGAGPGRTQGLMYAIFCMTWIASLLTFLKVAPGLSYEPNDPLARIGRRGAAVLLCTSLLLSVNNGIATRALLFDAVDWRRAMTQRYELVRQAAGQDGLAAEVVVPPVVAPPPFYRNSDIGPNAEFLVNRLFATYFGVRSVRVGDSVVTEFLQAEATKGQDIGERP